MNPSDLVAEWNVALSDKVHRVLFEHGTTTGKRVIYVDGEEVFRKNFMFRLVGQEHFNLGKEHCCISIMALDGFRYKYILNVGGRTLEEFSKNKSKIMCTWLLHAPNEPIRIVLEKDTMDVWVNGEVVQTTGEFAEDGTETHFVVLGKTPACIKSVSSGARRSGIVHTLFVEGAEIEPSKE